MTRTIEAMFDNEALETESLRAGEVAQYLLAITCELSTLAARFDHAELAHLLEMAAIEAQAVVSRHGGMSIGRH